MTQPSRSLSPVCSSSFTQYTQTYTSYLAHPLSYPISPVVLSAPTNPLPGRSCQLLLYIMIVHYFPPFHPSTSPRSWLRFPQKRGKPEEPTPPFLPSPLESGLPHRPRLSPPFYLPAESQGTDSTTRQGAQPFLGPPVTHMLTFLHPGAKFFV